MRQAVILVLLACFTTQAQEQIPTTTSPVPQDSVTGPRDNVTPKDSGTARISGRIVSADTGTPLRRAEVTLSGEGLKEGRSTSTDQDGRYDLKDLPAGRFQLTAYKAGYASASYGQKRPFQPGRPFELRDGQALQRMDLALPRGGVISGRITDEFGEPVAGVSVRAMRYSYSNGKRSLTPAGFGGSDDRGQYRIFGLAASDYYVSAQQQQGFNFAQSDSRAGFAPTFYPGTPSASEAQRVHVTPGSEFTAGNFALVPARTVKVSGSVVMSDGRPASEGFLMLQLGRSDEMSFTMTGGGMVQPDGSFTLSNVSPGDYVIHLTIGRDEDAESGSLPITVTGGEDVTGLTLATSRSSLVAGQVVFEGTPPERLKPAEFQMWMRPVDPAGMMYGGGMVPRDDWTFEGRANHGPVVVNASRFPEGWAIKSVLLNGEDVTDSGIPTRSGERVDGVQVVVTNRLTRVEGSVLTDTGQPVREYAAVFFSEDAALWTRFSRHVRLEPPDQQGRFLVKGLPPGRYLGAALDYIEDGQQTDPEFLESLRAWATPFEVREGEQKTLALKVVPRQ